MNNQLPDGSFDWIPSAEESLVPKTEPTEDPKADDESEDWNSELFRRFIDSAHQKDNAENSVAVPE